VKVGSASVGPSLESATQIEASDSMLSRHNVEGRDKQDQNFECKRRGRKDETTMHTEARIVQGTRKHATKTTKQGSTR
jgi:hypothetical protein